MPTIARYSDELYHHGIKGQKWGVRRFQNEDGSLTAAGRARYGVSTSSHAITKGNLKDPESKAFVQRLMNETTDKNEQALLAGVLAQGGKVEASINRPRLRDRDFTLNKDGSLRYYWGRSGNGKNATYVFVTTPNNSEDWRFVNRMCVRTDSDKWTKEENREFFAAASRLEDLTSRNHKNIDFLDGAYNKDRSNKRHKEIRRNRAIGVAGAMLALAGTGLATKAISDYNNKRAMGRFEYESQNYQQQADMARGADYISAVRRSVNTDNRTGSTSSGQSYRKGSIGDPNRYTKSGKVKRKYRNKRGE